METEQLSNLLLDTQTSPCIVHEAYGLWREAILQIAMICGPFYAGANPIEEMLRDSIDLAASDNGHLLQLHLASMQVLLPWSRDIAPSPVELIGSVVGVIARLRKHPVVFGVASSTMGLPDISLFRVAPLPHGWIIHQHFSRTGSIAATYAIGSCLADCEAKLSREACVARTKLEIQHGLLALFESWRLGHTPSRRHLCALAQHICNERS